MWILVAQRIIVEFVLDILLFPIWWYTGGARHALMFCVRMVKEVNVLLAPGLWLKNITVPMFGQYDIQGRIVSFFMRLANVIVRSIGLFIWVVIMVCVFFLWLLFPVFVSYMLFLSLFRVPYT